MTGKNQNPFAGQRGTVATLCMACALFFVFSGCEKQSSNPDDGGLENGATGVSEESQYEFIYTDTGEKQYASVKKDKVIIKTGSNTGAKALCREGIFSFAYDIDYWVIGTIDPEKTALDDLLQMPGVLDATYGLEYRDGTLHYPTDQIGVAFKEGQSIEKLLDAAVLKGIVEKTERFDSYSELYTITLNAKLGDILSICRSLFESGLCKSTGPSFFREMKPYNTHYSSQWGLRNIGQVGGTSGIDIRAERAWAITGGSAGIKVAVIDEGVDLDHPDLQANLLPGYDAVPAHINPGGANGSPFGDNAHGTACAGIVGAVNNTIGVVGVAPNARIIPVRIAFLAAGGTSWTTNEAWIANGINHAWQTDQADVLSCSWGGGLWSQYITNAINNAVTNGRNGKGCVAVFAAGNDYVSTVDYPASLATVIAVGAIDRNGQRAGFSNYGDALDVVAPGVDIYTTDISFHENIKGRNNTTF